MAKKINKFIYGYKISVNYGQGYEYECFETSFREARERIKEYRSNAPQYPVKLSQGREINPDYINQNN